ncbi:serine hydrolase domain-containing protein [Congregibacter litoralis]|uniref:Beta-lactamase class C and other penicillin binding protein n=1 Tax=Congregibacter litoralis KT71 TaxID=314285 RepID=A4A5U4_9GAMM|nr:serine hydrolase domain-containing protein [Congregibacter litoralis]EAQ98391.2 Beta-lactamase class C and other penicillin binding protein [Congregibacter litoralis KT71]
MVRTGLSAVFGFAAMLSTAALAEHEPTGLETLLKGTDLTPALSGLQISLLKNGKATKSYALGFAQITAAGKEPLRRDHKTRIASISKLVVALGIMQLVEAGKLDLDGDVSDYLGWELRNPAFPEFPITTRQLLAHTSSIRDGSAYFMAAGTGELRDFFKEESPYWEKGDHFARSPGQEPGRFFTYANLNFGLLGAIIELLSEERFDQYMAKNVLEPMGLSAGFDPCKIPPGQRAAAFRKGEEAGNWSEGSDWLAQVDGAEPKCFYGAGDATFNDAFLADYALGSNATIYSPQGGLRASADDLVVVLEMLVNGGVVKGQRILSPESVETMLAPQWTLNAEKSNGLSAGEAEPGGPTDGLMTSYGLSVHRINMSDWGFPDGPELLVGHLGEAYGVLSHALINPETGDGIATIITGTARDPADSPPGSSPLYRVEEEILRWWLEQKD